MYKNMELSEILNVVLGGSLVGAVISIVTIRSALKKARAEAEKAIAESDTVKITNTETATRILVENIVTPLKDELHETRKELSLLKKEMARFRKAVDSANSCKYSDDCPVLERMRGSQEDRDVVKVRPHLRSGVRSRSSSGAGQRDRAVGDSDGSGDCADVVGDSADSDGQPP